MFGIWKLFVEIEGEGTLAQSNAILGLIGRRHGLLPEDDFQAAQHLSLLGAVEDLRSRMNATASDDEDEKKAAREKLAGGYLKTWAHDVEKMIEGPFVGGAKLSVADLKLFTLMNFYKRGGFDYIAPTYFDDFKKLSALRDAVDAHPRIADWQARRSAA